MHFAFRHFHVCSCFYIFVFRGLIHFCHNILYYNVMSFLPSFVLSNISSTISVIFASSLSSCYFFLFLLDCGSKDVLLFRAYKTTMNPNLYLGWIMIFIYDICHYQICMDCLSTYLDILYCSNPFY